MKQQNDKSKVNELCNIILLSHSWTVHPLPSAPLVPLSDNMSQFGPAATLPTTFCSLHLLPETASPLCPPLTDPVACASASRPPGVPRTLAFWPCAFCLQRERWNWTQWHSRPCRFCTRRMAPHLVWDTAESAMEDVELSPFSLSGTSFGAASVQLHS